MRAVPEFSFTRPFPFPLSLVLCSDGSCSEGSDQPHLWSPTGEDQTANHFLQCLPDPFQLWGEASDIGLFDMWLNQMACVIEDMKSWIDFLDWVFNVMWELCSWCRDTLHTLLSSLEIANGKSSLKYCIRTACQSEWLQDEAFFFLSAIKRVLRTSLNIQ